MEWSIILFQTRSVHAFIFSGHDHGWKNEPEGTGINSIVFAFVNRATNRAGVFTWRHGGHIGVPKQWNGGHIGVPNQSSGSWTLFFLLFQSICINAGHVSENTLLRFSNILVRFFEIIQIRISDPRSLGSVDQMNRWILVHSGFIG